MAENNKMNADEVWDLYMQNTSANKKSAMDGVANSYNTQMNNLTQGYNTQSQNLAQQRAQSVQGAAIAGEKTNKYLQQKHQATGMAVGQAGSDMIQSRNATAQNLAGIQSNYSQQENDLWKYYLDEQTRAALEREEKEQAIIDLYMGIERENAQIQYNREQDAYAKQQAEYDARVEHAKKTLQDYMDEILSDGSVDEEEQAILDQLVAAYMDDSQEGHIDLGDRRKEFEDEYVKAMRDIDNANNNASFVKPKNTQQANANDLNSVMEGIVNSSWASNGWNAYWGVNPKFTYRGREYRVDTTANYVGNNKKAKSEIKSHSKDGETVLVTYEGNDYITDGKHIYQVH